MAQTRTPENPDLQYKVVIKAANIDPADREIRINKALDIMIDEALRAKVTTGRSENTRLPF